MASFPRLVRIGIVLRPNEGCYWRGDWKRWRFSDPPIRSKTKGGNAVKKRVPFFTSVFVQDRRQPIFSIRVVGSHRNRGPDVCVLSRTSVDGPDSGFAVTTIGVNGGVGDKRGFAKAARKPVSEISGEFWRVKARFLWHFRPSPFIITRYLSFRERPRGSGENVFRVPFASRRITSGRHQFIRPDDKWIGFSGSSATSVDRLTLAVVPGSSAPTNPGRAAYSSGSPAGRGYRSTTVSGCSGERGRAIRTHANRPHDVDVNKYRVLIESGFSAICARPTTVFDSSRDKSIWNIPYRYPCWLSVRTWNQLENTNTLFPFPMRRSISVYETSLSYNSEWFSNRCTRSSRPARQRVHCSMKSAEMYFGLYRFFWFLRHVT